MQTDMTAGKPAKMILNFTIPVFMGNVYFPTIAMIIFIMQNLLFRFALFYHKKDHLATMLMIFFGT